MDDILRNFVKAANEGGFSLDLTLNVKGVLVTGTTVSAKKYLQSLSRTFEDGNEVSQELSEKLSRASETNFSQEDIHFIHLEDAQVYNGDAHPTPSEESFYWRGKLEEVDGFFLGKIDASEK